jgi:hypothetical protein
MEENIKGIHEAAFVARERFFGYLNQKLGNRAIPTKLADEFVSLTDQIAEAMATKKQLLSFSDFVATRRFEMALGGMAHELYSNDDGPCAVFTYEGGTSISFLKDGRFYLILENTQYASHDIRDVEAELYAWCVRNF